MARPLRTGFCMSPLPIWVQYVQALALPIFGAVLALAGAWVGWQNMQVTRVKLQYDLYERRYKVFAAMRELIRHALYDTDLDTEAIRAHAFAAGEAAFLFDEDVAKYVRDMRDRISKFRKMKKELQEMSEGCDRDKLAKELQQERLYLMILLDPNRTERDSLITRFKPFLVLPKVKTFPWR
jgi:hypothetical protein